MLLVAAGPGIFADDHDKKTDVTITAPVEVPGGVVLQPGTYMFRLMEATGNRHIVQIRSEDGKKTFAITMTAAARRVEPTDKTVLTFYEMPADSPQAVRQWFWPGDLDGQEFLYPHKRAVEISRLAKRTVPEASAEEQTVAEKTVDADAQATVTEATAQVTETHTSENETPARVDAAPEPVNTAAVETAPAPVDTTPAPRPELLAQANPPAVQSSSSEKSSDDSTLPVTASDLPLITVIGFMALAAALAVRRFRRA
jgi:hypothetical protein